MIMANIIIGSMVSASSWRRHKAAKTLIKEGGGEIEMAAWRENGGSNNDNLVAGGGVSLSGVVSRGKIIHHQHQRRKTISCRKRCGSAWREK